MARLAFVNVSIALLMRELGLSGALVSPDMVRVLISSPDLDEVPETGVIPEVTITVHTQPAQASVVCRVDATYEGGRTVQLKKLPSGVELLCPDTRVPACQRCDVC
jgi:hypothetical protein